MACSDVLHVLAQAIHVVEQLVEVSHASHGLLHYKALQLMTIEGTCSEPLKAAVAGALRDPITGEEESKEGTKQEGLR